MKLQVFVVAGFALAFYALISPLVALSAELPKKLTSAACIKPPTIDGKIGADEWKAAPAVAFDLPVLHVKTQKVVNRSCQWRAMNSANGLYIALSVPDAEVNKSLTPLDFDLVTLAFCRGSELAVGDDRKVAAPGIYVDKHFVSPGKDGDDQHSDGKAAMVYDEKTKAYVIEWAVELDSGDAQDIQTKPGNELTFSMAYIDKFQADFKETEIGSPYPGGLDSAKNWGVLQLAADVKDDGGAAFRGPEWVRKALANFSSAPANRLRIVESILLPVGNRSVAKVLVEFSFVNPQGKGATGKGKLYLPIQNERVVENSQLYYSAGYELDDIGALGLAANGFVVATQRAIEANPLVRTVNPDTALLHICRALPFIDDSRVVVGGGSAGGYATLLVAAETFPLSGATPAVPPVNWGYNAAYFLQRDHGTSRPDKKEPKTPLFDSIVPLVQDGTKVYGPNTSDETYYRHSPLAHFDTITCPVSVYWTTADMLVPIDQVGLEWVRPIDASMFPAGFSFDPTKLTTSPLGQQRVTDVLKPEQYDLVVIPEDTIKQEIEKIKTTMKAPELTVSATKQWSITILDEGPPEPQLGHTKYAVPWSQRKFIAEKTSAKIAATQLTATKLERLMDRYAGREWLPTSLVHLDEVESEKADVVRGLKTYVAAGKEHAGVFGELYSKLRADKQVLPEDLVGELKSSASP